MSQDPPATGDPATEEVYCPRCFTVVEDDLVFCQECGQFIYAHAPADTRAWDSRTPKIPVPVIVVPDEALKITLPEDSFPSAPPVASGSDDVDDDEAAGEADAGMADENSDPDPDPDPDPVSGSAESASASETDTESA